MANSKQLRNKIDNGKGGSKVRFTDPSAAPLGADDEAAGYPPTKGEIVRAMDGEVATAAAAGPNVSDESTRSPSGEGVGLPPRGGTPLIFALLALFLLGGGLAFAYLAQ